MKNRPIINHVELILDGKWITLTFLPLFDDELLWAEDVTCGDCCSLACYSHPMVQDELDRHRHHKLCTLTVIRAYFTGLTGVETNTSSQALHVDRDPGGAGNQERNHGDREVRNGKRDRKI